MHQHFDPVQAQQEYGAPRQEARDPSPLPPGGGRWVLPHYSTFSQIVNWASRTYRWTFDEALRHNQNNARAARRDPVVMDALRSRQLPTAQLPWHLECEDDNDSRQADAVKEITAIIEAIPNLQTLKMHLLEALWWGRYGVQLTYAWDYSTGRRRLVVTQHRPINGDKLVFKYSGQEGVLVHATFPGEWEQTDRGRAHFFSPEDRERVIIHRHEPEDADFFEPELAGAVEGVGIRSRIYWFWWLRSQVSAFLMDYLERVGAGGFTIYYYEAGNPNSESEVRRAAEEQHRNNTILFPRNKDGSTGGPGIQRVEPSNSGAQLLQTLVSGYFDEVIRRYILGQNLTTEARGTGLGSGVADLHADTFSRIVKYDAINLAETLTRDLVWVIQKYLYPGLPPLRLVMDVDKPNARDVLESAQAFFSMGGAIDEDELRSIIGLAKPQPGHAILAKMGNLSPAGMPMGVPMMGQPGPDLGMGGMDPQGMGGMGAPMMMAKRPRRARKYAQEWDGRIADDAPLHRPGVADDPMGFDAVLEAELYPHRGRPGLPERSPGTGMRYGTHSGYGDPLRQLPSHGGTSYQGTAEDYLDSSGAPPHLRSIILKALHESSPEEAQLVRAYLEGDDSLAPYALDVLEDHGLGPHSRGALPKALGSWRDEAAHEHWRRSRGQGRGVPVEWEDVRPLVPFTHYYYGDDATARRGRAEDGTDNEDRVPRPTQPKPRGRGWREHLNSLLRRAGLRGERPVDPPSEPRSPATRNQPSSGDYQRHAERADSGESDYRMGRGMREHLGYAKRPRRAETYARGARDRFPATPQRGRWTLRALSPYLSHPSRDVRDLAEYIAETGDYEAIIPLHDALVEHGHGYDEQDFRDLLYEFGSYYGPDERDHQLVQSAGHPFMSQAWRAEQEGQQGVRPLTRSVYGPPGVGSNVHQAVFEGQYDPDWTEADRPMSHNQRIAEGSREELQEFYDSRFGLPSRHRMPFASQRGTEE